MRELSVAELVITMLDGVFGDGEWIVGLAGLIWKDMGLD
jgi:hypothetical protein